MPNIIDLIDILLVALLLYGTYKLMKSSGAMPIFMGIILFVLIWILVSYVFEMKLMGAIMDKFVSVGAIALIVLFQNEIKRFLVMLGSRKRWHGLVELFSVKKADKPKSEHWVMEVVLACQEMSKNKTGALIVLENKLSLDEFIKSGEVLDAVISGQLLQNLFFKNSPLHDGAVIISEGRIKAASCILPVAHDDTLPKDMGLRHRAALGLSQMTDAKVIVVSEETGRISVAYNGTLLTWVTMEDLERFLADR
jgi:uncharacterized protein (TIGR00159 family)